MSFHLNQKTAWKSHNNVCRKHFKKADFKNWNLLKRDVVPSLLLPHTISMEHDYADRNSIIMHVADVYDVGDLLAVTKNANFDAQKEDRPPENDTMEADQIADANAECVPMECVMENDIVEAVEEKCVMGNLNNNAKPMFSKNFNAERAREVLKPKSSRSYDPLARKMR